MFTQIYIDNLKCGGCANTLTRELNKLGGIKKVKVDIDHEMIELDTLENFDFRYVKEKLLSLGYPEKDTVHGFQKLTAGAKSYVSCAIGRLNGE